MAAPDIALPESPRKEPAGLIAPGWHTVVVIALLLAIAALTAWKGETSLAATLTSRDRMLSYATVLVWEWPMVAFIVWGVRRRGHGIKELIGGRWPTIGAFARDLGIGILFLLCSDLVLGAIKVAMHDTPNKAVRNLFPESPSEMALWVVLAATAGFCEETIFRGYLQQQFGRLMRDSGTGVALQAVVFGACHGYQGAKSMVAITVYGFLFGLLAHRVQNLRPGMLAHFLQDSVAGLAARAVLKRLPAG